MFLLYLVLIGDVGQIHSSCYMTPVNVKLMSPEHKLLSSGLCG